MSRVVVTNHGANPGRSVHLNLPATKGKFDQFIAEISKVLSVIVGFVSAQPFGPVPAKQVFFNRMVLTKAIFGWLFSRSKLTCKMGSLLFQMPLTSCRAPLSLPEYVRTTMPDSHVQEHIEYDVSFVPHSDTITEAGTFEYHESKLKEPAIGKSVLSILFLTRGQPLPFRNSLTTL